jgi:N-formylglutamate deformylase
MAERPRFAIVEPTGPRRPIVAHIPHASRVIPPDVRAGLLVDDADLERELLRLTDWHAYRLYASVADLGATRLVHGVSRLVVDPERFPDDMDEPMSRVGHGVVYTRTTDGRPLRADDPVERKRLVERYYRPYHAALTRLVAGTLDAFGSCLVLDCHSFATQPHPSEPDQSPDRPDICIGTDPFHTPPDLVATLVAAMEAEGFRVEVDRPFAGSLVPLAWHRTDRRVTSVMLETRRGLYCDESSGAVLPAFDAVAASIGRALGTAVGR